MHRMAAGQFLPLVALVERQAAFHAARSKRCRQLLVPSHAFRKLLWICSRKGRPLRGRGDPAQGSHPAVRKAAASLQLHNLCRLCATMSDRSSTGPAPQLPNRGFDLRKPAVDESCMNSRSTSDARLVVPMAQPHELTQSVHAEPTRSYAPSESSRSTCIHIRSEQKMGGLPSLVHPPHRPASCRPGLRFHGHKLAVEVNLNWLSFPAPGCTARRRRCPAAARLRTRPCCR